MTTVLSWIMVQCLNSVTQDSVAKGVAVLGPIVPLSLGKISIGLFIIFVKCLIDGALQFLLAERAAAHFGSRKSSTFDQVVSFLLYFLNLQLSASLAFELTFLETRLNLIIDFLGYSQWPFLCLL